MQGPGFIQRPQLRAIPVQIQANAILNMSLLELQQFIETEAMENPALGVEEGARCPVCGFMTSGQACPVCSASLKSTDNLDRVRSGERDYLEHAFAAAGRDEAFDPFRTVAAGSDLIGHLKQQARMSLSGRRLRIAEYLVECLDEDGYFRESLYETAEEFATAVPEIESVLGVVQSFDPPGIAARDLRESLLIQLRHASEASITASNAERILMDCWDDFSRMKLRAIAKSIGATLDVVQDACEFIRERLNPRPASGFRADFDDLTPREVASIVPDVIVHKGRDSFVTEVVDCHSSLLRIDETYEHVYQSIKEGDSYLNEEDCRHIKEHVERVKCILEAIGLRRKTLARVAMHLVEYQREFLIHGPSHLRPLKQKDLAQALGVHESTICRAVAGKYCRLPSGEVISFEVFFDAALPVRNLISQIIAVSTEPISDGEIAKRLTEQGVTIARRTVAKYREQLKVLPYQLRAA